MQDTFVKRSETQQSREYSSVGHLNPQKYTDEIDTEFALKYLKNQRFAEQYLCLPMKKRKARAGDPYEFVIDVAMVKPKDLAAKDFVRNILAEELKTCGLHVKEVPENEFKRAVDYVFGHVTVEPTEEEGEEETPETEDSILIDKPTDNAAIKAIRYALRDAINSSVSDIHFEFGRDDGRIRFRQDGVLVEKRRDIKEGLYKQIISWLKIQARMKIEETRLPQDGSFYISDKKSRIDVRFSSIPTVYSEKIVLRLLDARSAENIGNTLDQIIGEKEHLAKFKAAIELPNGIILVTGPTGSGKTTTLRAALTEMHNKYGETMNIVTAEDPVEYRVDGVNHIEVHEEIGLTFAACLRHIVRQDPDIIMIGEIRDKETAEIAVQSALTGHLVLSTLHTNSAIGAIPRLVNLEMKPYMLASTVKLLQAQRLVRKLCPNCGKRRQMKEKDLREMLDKLALQSYLDRLMAQPLYLPYEGEGKDGKKDTGCDVCENTAFKGRHAVMEMVYVESAGLRQAIEDNSIEGIYREAYAVGYKQMIDYGMDMVIRGQTALQETFDLISERVGASGSAPQGSAAPKKTVTVSEISASAFSVSDIEKKGSETEKAVATSFSPLANGRGATVAKKARTSKFLLD